MTAVELGLKIKDKLSELSAQEVSNLYTGYSARKERKNYFKIQRLITYYSVLLRYEERLKWGDLDECKDCLDFESFSERVINLTGKYCGENTTDFKIDESKEHLWLMKSPQCRSYEEWEKWSKFFCRKLELQLEIERKECNLTFEISREIVNCDTLLAISAYRTACDTNLKISRTPEECTIDFKLLKEDITNCDLQQKDYDNLISANVSYDIIKNVYDAGHKLKVKGKKVYLITQLDEYPLDSFPSDINLKYLSEFDLKTALDKNSFLDDYNG